MSTLNELKDWIEQGGKICQSNWCDNKYIKKDGDEWVDDEGVKAGLGPEMALADNWVKFEEVKKPWKPEFGEDYYFVCSRGEVGDDTWTNHNSDKTTYNSYNCFKTKEEAEHARDLWIAERELRDLADGGEYNILYHKMENRFYAEFLVTFKSPHTFSSQEKAERVIKQLGEDKLKLIFGVK